MALVIRVASTDAQVSGSGGGGAAPEPDAADGERSTKRQRVQPGRVLHTLPTHRVVLATQSAWAKAMLNNVQPPQVRRARDRRGHGSGRAWCAPRARFRTVG